VNNLNQDTTVIGGYIKYETAPFYGIQAAVGYDIQRRLDDKNENDEDPDLNYSQNSHY
jgi:hypothetical protein